MANTPADSRMASPPPMGRRAQSPDIPPLQGGNLNVGDNLRNIGKFFKRDIGGFGRFGGGGGRGEDG